MLFSYRCLLIGAALLSVWLIISMRIGGVVPEDFVNSDIPLQELSFDSWQIYGSNEWLNLARRSFHEGQWEEAQQAAYKALSVDPSNGGVFSLLAAVYEQQEKREKAKQVFDFGWKTWPAKYYRISTERAQHIHDQQLQSQLEKLEHDSRQWIDTETQKIRATGTARQMNPEYVAQFIADTQKTHEQRVQQIRSNIEKQWQEALTKQLEVLKTRYDKHSQ